ncbi:MAG: GH92 family glycosyl hydrolase [Chitinophagaceae bacterium]|nr:GH92 family glycosyl hydrolase [Chitinophagaceae bacterium]
MKRYILLLGALVVLRAAWAQSKYSPSSVFMSYKGLVMAGYQGWFNAPDDGAGRGWNHYNNHGKFEPGTCKIDIWPEVSEYKKTYKTPFVDKDGKPCYVYSSYDASSTDLHFKWMKEYGVDGAFVQRFVSNVKSPVSLHHNNVVLQHALKAAEKYHRAIAVMYDFSGMREGDDTTVIRDWKSLVDDLKVARRGRKQTYLYHRGRPLVVLWGVGFNDHRPYGLKEVEKIMDFLQHDPVYGGCSIMLGVPTYWRDLGRDTEKDPRLLDVIRKADIVHPWFVGRYNEETYVNFRDRLPADIAWCKENKVDYVPTVFPGFSWHNMYNKSPMNQIPRNRGKFYWQQIAGAIGAGAEMLYVAMFDEVDEGTAILKASKNPPVGESSFVTFEDDVPSDYYLTLTGYAGKMLRKEIPFSEDVPGGGSASREPRSAGKGGLTSFVDPYIGSGGHGHVFVGASVPFGGIQPGPMNIFKGWDWDSGYNYGDSILIGFSHTHLNGTGIGDLGDVLIMPYTGAVRTDKGTEKDHRSGYASLYAHQREKVRPGYYSVVLDDHQVQVELTATERVALHRYRFTGGGKGHVIVDLKEGVQDQSYETYIEQTDDTTFKGYRFSKGWAKEQRVWFAIRTSLPVKDFQVYEGDQLLTGRGGKGKAIKGLMNFEQAPGVLELKVSLSPVSADNALANIGAELPGWNFEQVAQTADASWEKELSKVLVDPKNIVDKKIFYTALYHTMIDPSLFNDYNGDFRGADGKVYAGQGFSNYTIFSLWDTYRAVHPLYTLLQPARVNDMIRTMLAIYDQQGRLPIWHLMGYETGTMVGISSQQVIAEAWLKGIRGYDGERAFRAIKATALSDSLGMMYVKNLQWIPSDKQSRSVAKALEYCISDASTALMAKQMGKEEDYTYFSRRAQNYKLYYDPAVGFFRGKESDGSWRQPFDPLRSTRPWAHDYAEGNAWQYLWLVPEDVKGLMDLLGGEKMFVTRLDSFFIVQSPADGGTLSDLTGLIGQYAHGNEPSHHIAYLYASAGQQWRTAEKVHYILKEFYQAQPDGTIGNEDCGQMSAWYVFSSMGFYPVFPASGKYVIGSPLFDKVTLALDGGRRFEVRVVRDSPEDIYVTGATLNGERYTKSYILHEDILKGGALVLTMGRDPNKDFGRDPADRP